MTPTTILSTTKTTSTTTATMNTTNPCDATVAAVGLFVTGHVFPLQPWGIIIIIMVLLLVVVLVESSLVTNQRLVLSFRQHGQRSS